MPHARLPWRRRAINLPPWRCFASLQPQALCLALGALCSTRARLVRTRALPSTGTSTWRTRSSIGRPAGSVGGLIEFRVSLSLTARDGGNSISPLFSAIIENSHLKVLLGK